MPRTDNPDGKARPDTMTVRTRFAPSPTGFLHIGGVRTALFNWLLARRHGGQFILRIDDTDQSRHVDDAVDRILQGFRWIGIDWDEGPEVGGPHGPYFQSQRSHLYAAAAARLLAGGHAYRDYSTDHQRAADKLAAEKAKQAYRFRRPEVSDADLAAFEAEGRPFALRFAVPPGRTLVVRDAIKGDVEQKTDDLGDFVVVRPDGSPLYNFASAVDDAEMQITHVVRAEEHLTNTFSQLLVLEALGAPAPVYAHIPFVAEPGSKKKISKRKMEEYAKVGLMVYLHEYADLGYRPEAMMNYLARLGWSLDDSQEVFERADLVAKFGLDRVKNAPASHDSDKLFWLQGEWMKRLTTAEKVEACLPYLEREGLATTPVDDASRAKVEAVVVALGDRLKVFSDIVRLGRYFFEDTLTLDRDAVKKRLKKEGVPTLLADVAAILEAVVPYDLPTLEKAVHDYAESHSLGMGLVVNALRVATTGQAVGPGLYDCLVILGREASVRRIGETLATLDNPAPLRD